MPKSTKLPNEIILQPTSITIPNLTYFAF